MKLTNDGSYFLSCDKKVIQRLIFAEWRVVDGNKNDFFISAISAEVGAVVFFFARNRAIRRFILKQLDRMEKVERHANLDYWHTIKWGNIK